MFSVSRFYAHRRWIVTKLLETVVDWLCVGSLRHEFAVVSRVANVYPRCYYAWNYRIWLIEHLLSSSSSSRTMPKNELEWFEPIVLLSAELFDCAAWLRRHIGDGSAYNHRRFLLTRLLTFAKSSGVDVTTSILQSEFNLLKHIIS